MTVRASEIAALAAAIAEVRRFATPADSGLSTFFRTRRELGARDRAFIADGSFAYLRRKRSLEALAGTDDPRRLALAVVLREMGRSLRDLAPALNTADDVWARAFKSRLHDALPPAVAHDVPDWLWDRLGSAYGEDTRAALARAWQDPAPFDLRVNVMKTTREAALAALVADGLAATATPFSPLGIRVTGRPSLARHPWLADGRLEVPDWTQFNAGAYFEQHESFEHVWRAEPGPVRQLYQGLLLIGVAFLQIQRRNEAGARKTFQRARQYLVALPDVCQSVDVARFRADAEAARRELERLGPERIDQFDPAFFCRIHLVN